MIWRLLTCFSLAVFALLGATFSGRVQLRDSKDPNVRKRLDYSGVVLWLEPLAAPAPEIKPARAKMIQKDKTFIPHILAVAAGTTVDFPNYDPIFHNAFSNYDGQIFDIGLYPPGSTRSVRFTRPGVVRIFCNIHATMSAVIVVVPTPWFSVTAKDGSFSIHGLPAGLYRLELFHERATKATLDRLATEVSITDAVETLPPITISESGYLSVPHKNKYGHEYPPPPSDEGFYPAVRK